MNSFPMEISPKISRRKTNLALCVYLVTSVWNPLMAEPLEDGITAARRGDFVTAFRLWLIDAQNGNASAQNNVALMLAQGQGVGKDATNAVEWWKRAAAQGLADAQSQLGFCYSFGEGVPVDLVEGVRWYRLAAQQGNMFAQSNLGAAYGEGRGAPQDWVESTKWYSLAAEQGFPLAQSNLGVAYANGYGIKQDYVQGYKWYGLALHSLPADDKDGRHIVVGNQARLVRLMSQVQIDEAERLINQWKPRQNIRR